MDNGANGGMAGDDVLITAYHDHDSAQVTGIAGNILDDLRIVTAAGLSESTDGPAIGICRGCGSMVRRGTSVRRSTTVGRSTTVRRGNILVCSSPGTPAQVNGFCLTFQ